VTLLLAGANVNARNAKQQTALMLVMQPAVAELLIEFKVLFPFGLRPVSCSHAHFIVCATQADVRAVDEHKETPLHHAAEFDRPAVISLLVKKGKADLNALNKDVRAAPR
jgi:ankyrin repeat protein